MKNIRAFARSTAHALMIALALTYALALGAQAAGGKASTFENALLKLVFNGNTVTGIADNTASTPATVLCLALHTADPGSGGTQTTNEAAYGSYARVAVNRNSGGWTVSSNQVALTSIEQFPAATSGSRDGDLFLGRRPDLGVDLHRLPGDPLSRPGHAEHRRLDGRHPRTDDLDARHRAIMPGA